MVFLKSLNIIIERSLLINFIIALILTSIHNYIATKVPFFVLFYRPDWILKYQGMVILAGSQVWWTWEVEDVFDQVKKGNKLAMKNYAKKMHQQIGDLVVKVSCEALATQKEEICSKS